MYMPFFLALMSVPFTCCCPEGVKENLVKVKEILLSRYLKGPASMIYDVNSPLFRSFLSSKGPAVERR